MNWDAISFDWNHIRAFLAVVDQGSLSGAGRVLRQTQPTLSRQITALEAALEVDLFTRGPREMKLTVPGLKLLSHVEDMADAAAQISRIATGQNQSVEGIVRISATDAMAAYVLPDCLVALRETHPGIRTELVLSNEISDLSRRDADIAIRHARPEPVDLIAKRVADVDVSLFASAAYLQSIGAPTTAQGFAAADFIGFERPERLVPQIQAMGLPIDVENFRITTSNGIAMYELAKKGLGIALLPKVIARDHMGLCQILPDLPTRKLPIWLVTHREIATNLRIRLCFDLLSRALGAYRDP